MHFVWGRSRLPATEAGWSGSGMGQVHRIPNRRTEKPNTIHPGTFAPQVKGFKISRNRDLGDQNLPLAHTCFFQIELPAYSTLEVPLTTASSLRTRSLVPMRWKICKEKLLYAIRNCRGFLIA